MVARARLDVLVLGLGLASLLGAGCEPPPEESLGQPFLWHEPGSGDAGVSPFFSVVVLPDTQYYSLAYPDIFDAQTRWIVDERVRGNVVAVLHEGDIVDDDKTEQWANASRSLHALDGAVPYALAMGNHDYTGAGGVPSRETLVDRYFPVSGFAGSSWFRGTFTPGSIDNSYHVIDTPAGQLLVLALEFGPRDDVLGWADGILKQHPDLSAIVVTHAYLYCDDTRYDHVTRPDQYYNPHDYGVGAIPGGVNDGEEMWRKLVLPNSNVRFVLSGHVLCGVGRLTSTRPDGTLVHQILANYQMEALGGGGYLRVMQFHPDERRLRVRTYSPYLRAFWEDERNEFTLYY